MTQTAISSELSAIAAARHGAILTEDLLALGWSYDRINRNRTLRRLVRGAYCISEPADAEAEHRLLCIAVALTNPSVCISHLSAAIMWQFPMLGPPPRDVHVMSVGPRESGWLTRAGIRHHGQPIEPGDVAVIDGVRVSGLARTLVDCARMLPIEEATVMIDAALTPVTPIAVN